MGDNLEITSRQTEYVVIINKETSTKIEDFMTPWAGARLIGCGHIWSYSKNALFLKKTFLCTSVHLADKLIV